MSCNPAIGGLAKGHLAREIDALGGEMGKNNGFGRATISDVEYKEGTGSLGSRAQCDKKAYQFRLKWVCESEPNLDVKQGQSSKILHKDGLAIGVETTMDVQYIAKAIVVTNRDVLKRLDAHRIKPTIRRTCRRCSSDRAFFFTQRSWT